MRGTLLLLSAFKRVGHNAEFTSKSLHRRCELEWRSVNLSSVQSNSLRRRRTRAANLATLQCQNRASARECFLKRRYASRSGAPERGPAVLRSHETVLLTQWRRERVPSTAYVDATLYECAFCPKPTMWRSNTQFRKRQRGQ